jgi:hypothetical protein
MMHKYKVTNIRTGRSFVRYGKSRRNVERRLGSSVSHRDVYVVKSIRKG